MSPEAGLYVHVPFCSTLCPYCDFAVNLATAARRSRYVDLLLTEISLRGKPEDPFDTLYFGGGTPSLLPLSDLRRVIGTLSDIGWLQPGCRLFLEANPEDVSEASLAGLREAGVSTLSLGVQSLDPESLLFLGRRHTTEEAEEAIVLSRRAGFDTVSVDLIYGLPGQTEERLRRDLEAACALSPEHFSCYQLTVHEKTLFGRRKNEGRLEEASEAAQSVLFRLTHQVLESAGYEAYEVSNFARSPEHRSRHNQKYWAHAPYLGLGPGAHSFDGRTRSWNERSFFDWERRLRGSELAVAGREELGVEELLLETLMLRLRTREGLDLEDVENRFGVDLLGLNRALIEKGLQDALLVREGSWIRPTLDGLAIADGLASSFRLAPAPWKPERV
jgi:putative oxygen-independent coproporphyrinogen III oxidase